MAYVQPLSSEISVGNLANHNNAEVTKAKPKKTCYMHTRSDGDI